MGDPLNMAKANPTRHKLLEMARLNTETLGKLGECHGKCQVQERVIDSYRQRFGLIESFRNWEKERTEFRFSISDHELELTLKTASQIADYWAGQILRNLQMQRRQ